jgi:microcin C transport system ATP-binding protein
MALACEPRLLLADEPTTALDVTLRGQMLDLLSQLQQQTGMAILLITHDLPLVKRFADRVVVMERGEVVEQGSVADVFSAPAHPYTRQLLDSHPRRDVLANPLPEGLPPVLQGRGVRVSYPVRLPGLQGWFRCGESVAVQNADFDLCPGQTLGVVGESGSGKSTLALAALDLIPFSGAVLVADQPWSAEAGANRRQRQQVQVVFQDPFSSLSPRMTVEQIVGEGLLVHEPGLTAVQRQGRVVVALQEVGLLPVDEPAVGLEADRTSWGRLAHAMLARYPHEFSGGQRQRLAIARALVVRPTVLVLDEPTSALDVTVQKQVLELLQRLQREMGLSYLLITHDMDVIRAMAHHVMVLQAGEVVEFGALSQVLANPRHPHTQALLLASGGE